MTLKVDFAKTILQHYIMKSQFALILLLGAIFGLTSCASLKTEEAAEPIKVLMLGGDASHDFELCYNVLDRKILEDAGIATITYTENVKVATAALANTDVFMACGNIKYDKAFKKSLREYLDNDGDLMLMHAAVWRRKGWPYLNDKIVGGMSKSHENKDLTFDVKNLMPKHPLMKGVPAQFGIIDELYRVEHLQKEIEWTILAESKSRKTGKGYPSIWISAREKGTVLSCALGHDQRAHDVPAYKQFLRNAITWLGHKK